MKVIDVIELLEQFDGDMSVMYWFDGAARGDIDTARIIKDVGATNVVILHTNDESASISRDQESK